MVQKSVLSIFLISLIIGCATFSSRSSRPLVNHKPVEPDVPTLLRLSDLERAQLSQRTLQLHENGHIPLELVIQDTQSPVELFHQAHAIVQWLYQEKNFVKCAEFTGWIMQEVFHPPASYSFLVMHYMGTYKIAWDIESITVGLQDPHLSFQHTPFAETLLFLTTTLPTLARSNNTAIALPLLDNIFKTYGPADIIFEKIEEAYIYSPLQTQLIQTDYRKASTAELAGLIYAEQIFSLYDQLFFSEVQKHGTQFLEHFPRHRLTPKIKELVFHALQKTHWKGFNIALLLPLTGPYAKSGKDILNGILYTFQIFENEKTIQSSRPALTFFPIDTHLQGQFLSETLSEIITQENIFLIVGPYLAQNHRSILPTIQKHAIPLLTLAPIETFDDDRRMEIAPILNLRPSLAYQLSFMMQYLSKTIHEINSLATLYPNNDFGYFHATAFQHASYFLSKPIRSAETYEAGNQKTYRNSVQRLLGLFDRQDRQSERQALIETIEVEKEPPPKPTEIDLPPKTDFELLYAPSPIRDASILVPLFKYFEAQEILILGPSFWNTKDMILRTRPYLQNVILFDTFYEFESDPRYKKFKRMFKLKYNDNFNRNNFLGQLASEVLLKTLARFAHNDVPTREDFLEQIQLVEGRTLFGQPWKITDNGTLQLDPIPLAFHKKSFQKINEEMIAKIRESVFPIKVRKEAADKPERDGENKAE
jgi:hypothetical protein